MADDQLLIDVLRAAGHIDAANLAEKLSAHTSTKTAESAQEPAQEPAARRALSPAEAERVAEGEFMLAAMKRHLPDRFAA